MENYKNYGYLNLANQTRGRRKPKKNTFLHTLLFYILPFIVVNLIIFLIVTLPPNFEITINNLGDHKNAEVIVEIKSLYPVKEFSATLNSEPLEMTQEEKRTYRTTVQSNGTLQVTVTNLNGMTKTNYENISYIDEDPPIVTEADSGFGYASMYARDSMSGVDFDNIYAIEADGRQIKPSLVDPGDGLVVFNYDSDSIEVHIPDKAGRDAVTTFGGAAESAGSALPDNTAPVLEGPGEGGQA